jgi:hypothetical protein
MPPRVQAGQALGMTQCASPLDTDSAAEGTSKEAIRAMDEDDEPAYATRLRMRRFVEEAILIAVLLFILHYFIF